MPFPCLKMFVKFQATLPGPQFSRQRVLKGNLGLQASIEATMVDRQAVELKLHTTESDQVQPGGSKKNDTSSIVSIKVNALRHLIGPTTPEVCESKQAPGSLTNQAKK